MARAAHVLTRRATPPSLVGVRVEVWVGPLSPPRVSGAGWCQRVQPDCLWCFGACRRRTLGTQRHIY